jgi:hypothetical protein
LSAAFVLSVKYDPPTGDHEGFPWYDTSPFMITDQSRVLPGALLVLGIHLPMDGSFASGGYAFPRAARSEGANDVSVGSAQDPWPHSRSEALNQPSIKHHTSKHR